MSSSDASVHSLSLEQTRALRLRSQRLDLIGNGKSVEVDGLLRAICGVQAQDAFAARLAIRVRGPGLHVADVDAALDRTPSIVRTWCMRGTLHLLAADDLGWLLPLLGPIGIRKDKQRNADLGISDQTYERVVPTLRKSLAEKGPLNREQLANVLSGTGIPTEGQRIYHLIKRAALEGLICYGPDRDGKHTWVLLHDWARIGEALEPESARAELARRYLEAFGPAEPEDFVRWSGLPVREAKEAFFSISDELIELDVGGSRSWMPITHASWLEMPPPENEMVRLLPSFDPYLLGYRSRDLAVDAKFASQVHPGGGIIRPTLLVGGRAAGIWTRKKNKLGLNIELKPFAPLDAELEGLVEQEAQALGDFLGVNATLRIAAAE